MGKSGVEIHFQLSPKVLRILENDLEMRPVTRVHICFNPALFPRSIKITGYAEQKSNSAFYLF